MCGRYAITLPPEAVRAFFNYIEQPNFPPRYNIAPTQPIPIVAAREHTAGAERRFRLMRWGFLPTFVKDAKTFPLIINARAEGIAEKASFRAAFKRRRCLVVADGYYEWRVIAPKQPKQPYLIRRIDRAPMGFAGLYETYMDATGGELDTACIITTSANALTREVHDRMPVILPREAFSAWLDNEATPPADALDMLRPAPEDILELTPVSKSVGNFANDTEAVQAPVGPAVRAASA
jgi:putative SOS response-associated peptidase YedK